MHRTSLLASLSAFALVAALSCGGSDLVVPSETGAADITLIRGDNQRGPAGRALPESLMVRVLDRRGQAVPNQRVAFSLATVAPGAQISPVIAETGVDGVAQARWVLGSTSDIQTAVARVVGSDRLEIRFNASVASVEASRMESAAGNLQGARVGTALPDPLVVRVTDALGNPVAGFTVEWSAQQGSVDPAASITGEDGLAATAWTLGSSIGPQTASASSTGLEGTPVTFSATAQAGSASALERVSGDNQSAQAGRQLSDPLVVRLIDQAGYGVPGQAVSWVVATGGGEVSSANSITDGEGRASTRWTLGPNPGGNSLNAVVSGIGAVGFSATGTQSGGGGGGESSPSRLEFRVQPSDVREDKKFSPPVEVVVLDAEGNRFTDREIEIRLELSGDNDGELRGDHTERTRSGIATFSDLKVDRRGDYRLHASADGLPSVESQGFRVFRDRHDDDDGD